MVMDRILITGASGFIGSHMVDEALARGYEVWAGVRKSSSRRYLKDPRIHIIELDLSDEVRLTEQLKPFALAADNVREATCSGSQGTPPRGCGEGTYVVHTAALTKARNEKEFYDVNTEGTKHLVNALQKAGVKVERFVFISSLSVFGPVREQQPYSDILPTDTPCPNTAYGKSKLLAEQYLFKWRMENGKWKMENGKWKMENGGWKMESTILRLTGVYGPREKDYMMLVDSIRKRIDIAAGYSRQDLTFVYVKDVVNAVFLSMKSAKTAGKAYFLTDGKTYTSRDFSDLVMAEFGIRHILRLTLPLWVLRVACEVSGVWGRLTGKMTTLNHDHYNILKQRNWRCDISAAQRDFGYSPQYDLHRGVHEMLNSEL